MYVYSFIHSFIHSFIYIFIIYSLNVYLFFEVRDDDRLSVVTYDTHVKVDFGLMNMDKTNKGHGSSIIHQIRDGSSTNLSGGLLKGLCQIIDRGDVKNEVASVLLFTDGLANHGMNF